MSGIKKGRLLKGLLGLAYLGLVCIFNLYVPGQAGASSVLYIASATTSSASSNTDIAVSTPSGTQEGDVMIAVVGANNASTVASTDPSYPWTVVTNTTYPSSNGTVASLYRVAGPSEPSTHNFQISGANNRMAASISTYRGVDTTTPIDATSSSNSGTGTSLTANTITTVTNQAMVISIFGISATNPQTFTPASSPATRERVDVGSTNAGNPNASIEVTDFRQNTAGNFTPGASTVGASSNWGTHQLALRPAGVQHLMLFWDGAGSAPAGWSFVTEAEGRFPRGESPANYGLTGGDGSRPFTPTDTVTLGAPSNRADSGNNTNTSAATHTHAITHVVGADNNGDASNPDIPGFRNLRLIRYEAGIPTNIPAGAIVMLSSPPPVTTPTYFSRYTAQDNRMVRFDSAANIGVTGGGDTVTNSICLTASTSPCGTMTLAAASGVLGANTFLAGNQTASTTHTHTLAGSATGATSAAPAGSAGNALPPYAQPLLYKALLDTPTLTLNITAMFDGDPGTGWNVISDSPGELYYQGFVRPNNTATYVTNQVGQTSHTNSYSVTSSASTTTGANTFLAGLANDLAGASHTHQVTFNLSAQSNIPPYYNVVVAQKISFTLNHYQWYIDTGTEALATNDKWPTGTLNLGQDSQLPAIPAAYQPPSDQSQLRLRVQIRVDGQALPTNTIAFKLQYSVGTTGSDCFSGTWLDVDSNASTSRPWRYGSNGVTDGSQLVTNTFPSDNLENFYRSASTGSGFTNPAAAGTGTTMEYDWLIQDYQALGAGQVNFRVVENRGTTDSGVLLSLYSTCPSLVTSPETNQVMRHGNFFQDGSEKGFFWAN